MKNQEFWIDSQNRYYATTGESPKPFAGQVFVAFIGDTPDAVKEDVLTKGELSGLNRVDSADVPDEWRVAFQKHGFEFVVETPPEVEEKQPVAKKQPPVPEVTGLQAELEDLKLQIEREKLVKELAAVQGEGIDYANPFDIQFRHFVLCILGGLWVLYFWIKAIV